MNLFFEETGDFRTGSVLAHVGETYQVELPGGKRTKVRARDVLLQYTSYDPAQLMADARETAAEIDLDFLWEVAGEEEFGFAELGAEYFGHDPKPQEAAGLLLSLHSAPMYFYRKGKGRYKAAPEQSLKAALASIEKKKQLAIIQTQYVEQLKQGVLPDALKAIIPQLLFKPDKNGIEYKALNAACEEMQSSPANLILNLGGIASPKDLHMLQFLFENFPKGIGFPSNNISAVPSDLVAADVKAFSIDDIDTVEIDDAFSVNFLSDDRVRVGIHIAVPALGMRPGDAIDHIARQRMSTVYMPGDKITMLPNELVRLYTLGEKQSRPALCLYTTLDLSDFSVVSVETKLEMVWVENNLRNNEQEAVITEENLESDLGDYPHKREIAILWRWVQVLEKGRMAKREGFGLKPTQTNRVDYNFYIKNDIVTILARQRDMPLDKIVSELMIYTNSSWGKLLHDHGVPGIYRSQGEGTGGWMSRMQAKMVTYAAVHQSLGVDQYIWGTSPLRRYTDLVNQWQILACVQHGVAAPLSAPFRHKDADLYAIISAFDSLYSTYAEFQSKMERYWCLRWLSQNNVRQVDALVTRNESVELTTIPLTISLTGVRTMARGTQVKLELLRWDEVDLSVEARLLEVLELAPDAEQNDRAEEAEE